MLKRVFVVTMVVLAAYSPSSYLAAEPSRHQPPAAAQHEHDQPAAAGMAGMTKMHQQMMAEMSAADARLDQLLSVMTAATGEAKVAGIAAVVTELVHQQKTMHQRMGTMHDQMMMGGRGMMMKMP